VSAPPNPLEYNVQTNKKANARETLYVHMPLNIIPPFVTSVACHHVGMQTSGVEVVLVSFNIQP